MRPFDKGDCLDNHPLGLDKTSLIFHIMATKTPFIVLNQNSVSVVITCF